MGDNDAGDYDSMVYQCPSYATAMGYMGVVAAVTLSNMGSAYGTWQSGVSLVHTGIRNPADIMKNVIPIVMAGVIGIYGLIVGVILGQGIGKPTNDRANTYSFYTGMAHLCAGLCTGICGLAAGICIGIVGDHGIRAIGYRATRVTLFQQFDRQGPGTEDKETPLVEGEGGAASETMMSASQDQNKLFVGMLIMLIFAEALALYGMIVALIVSQNSYSCG